MASQPFKLKEIQKEKETAVEKFVKEYQKDIKDKHEKESKHDKEKPEKEKPEKSEKIEEKELKDKHEKEVKDKHEKDKSEKEGKEHKLEIKDTKDKEVLEKTHLDKLPEKAGAAEGPGAGGLTQEAATEAARAAGITKIVEKPYAEKPYFYEKAFHKEFKFEKFEIKEWDKYIEVGPVGPDPGELTTRVSNLEAAMQKLLHFIPESERPDLGKGALKNEPASGGPEEKQSPEPESGTTA